MIDADEGIALLFMFSVDFVIGDTKSSVFLDILLVSDNLLLIVEDVNKLPRQEEDDDEVVVGGGRMTADSSSIAELLAYDEFLWTVVVVVVVLSAEDSFDVIELNVHCWFCLRTAATDGLSVPASSVMALSQLPPPSSLSLMGM